MIESGQYQLQFEDRGDYLYAHLSGADSFAASLLYWNDIADEIGRLGYHKLLVHESMAGHISGREMYDLIMDLKDSSLKDVQIAFYDEMSSDTFLNNLGKLIANHRGGSVRLFSRLDEAQRWIERTP